MYVPAFVLGMLTITALYNFFLFLLYKKNTMALYASLICLCSVVFNLCTIFYSPYCEKIVSLVFIVNPVLFVYFLRSFFPEEFDDRCVVLFRNMGAALSVAVLLCPQEIYLRHLTNINKFISVIMLLNIIFIFYGLFYAIKHKREDGVILAIGIVGLAVSAIVRYFLKPNFAFVHNPEFSVVLMVIYSFVTAKRFSNSYYRCEEMVEVRTKELNKLNLELEYSSSIDEVTKLYNRKYFVKIANHVFGQAKEGNLRLSVFLLDIDDFKGINDTYGHIVGDEVLARVGSIIKCLIGTRGIACRFGGEEFIVILPECDLKNALVIGEELRKEMKKVQFCDDYLNPFHISCSVGITEYYGGYNSLEQLLKAADNALYAAKSNGKDCCCFYDFICGEYHEVARV